MVRKNPIRETAAYERGYSTRWHELNGREDFGGSEVETIVPLRFTTKAETIDYQAGQREAEVDHHRYRTARAMGIRR